MKVLNTYIKRLDENPRIWSVMSYVINFLFFSGAAMTL